MLTSMIWTSPTTKEKSTRKPFSTICIFMVMVTTTMSFSILYLSYYWYGWWWWSCLWTSIAVYMYKSCKQPLVGFFLLFFFSLSLLFIQKMCVWVTLFFLSFLNREIARLSHYTSSTTTTTHYFFYFFQFLFLSISERSLKKLLKNYLRFMLLSFSGFERKKVVAQLQAYCNNFLLEELFLCV